VAFEEFSERGTIMGAYLRPEVTVGFAVKNHSHDYLMSASRRKFQIGSNKPVTIEIRFSRRHERPSSLAKRHLR